MYSAINQDCHQSNNIAVFTGNVGSEFKYLNNNNTNQKKYLNNNNTQKNLMLQANGEVKSNKYDITPISNIYKDGVNEYTGLKFKKADGNFMSVGEVFNHTKLSDLSNYVWTFLSNHYNDKKDFQMGILPFTLKDIDNIDFTVIILKTNSRVFQQSCDSVLDIYRTNRGDDLYSIKEVMLKNPDSHWVCYKSKSGIDLISPNICGTNSTFKLDIRNKDSIMKLNSICQISNEVINKKIGTQFFQLIHHILTVENRKFYEDKVIFLNTHGYGMSIFHFRFEFLKKQDYLSGERRFRLKENWKIIHDDLAVRNSIQNE